MSNNNLDRFLSWFEKYLADHQIQVGDALPSEEEIVQLVGISRTAVREALMRLRALGLVTRLNTVLASYSSRFPGLRVDD